MCIRDRKKYENNFAVTGYVAKDAEVYQFTNTKMCIRDSFFSGKAGEGIGGPHIGYDMVWPLSLIPILRVIIILPWLCLGA